jgi:beta-barrel assembly-enhancing protease
MSSLAVRVFGPDLPAGGAAGTLALGLTGVEVVLDNHRQSVALSDLQLRFVGFGTPGLELAWQKTGDRWAAHVLDPVAAQTVLDHPAIAGSVQAAALRGRKRRTSGIRVLGWSLLAAFVLLPGLILALFVLNSDRIARWVTEQISIEQEVSLGRSSFDSMRTQLKIRDSGPAYDAVQTIGKRLTAGSRYQYEFHVAEDPALNAFAVPGGFVVVHTGLIKATRTPEELAGVLAHEVQHVEQRHSLQGMVKNLGLRGLWMLVSGDLGSTLAGQAALQLTSLKFSRDAETEADSKGFDALAAAGIDPRGMPEFFETMRKQAADAPAAFISSHPLSEQRRELLLGRMEQLTRQHFAPLPIAPWPPGA